MVKTDYHSVCTSLGANFRVLQDCSWRSVRSQNELWLEHHSLRRGREKRLFIELRHDHALGIYV